MKGQKHKQVVAEALLQWHDKGAVKGTAATMALYDGRTNQDNHKSQMAVGRAKP